MTPSTIQPCSQRVEYDHIHHTVWFSMSEVWSHPPYSLALNEWSMTTSTIQPGSQWVEYDSIHHTAWLSMSGVWPHPPYSLALNDWSITASTIQSFRFFLLTAVNNFSPLNILNWNILWFWKCIPHGHKCLLHDQKEYHIVTCYDLTSYMAHTKCYIMWYASNYGIIILSVQWSDVIYWRYIMKTSNARVNLMCVERGRANLNVSIPHHRDVCTYWLIYV